MRKTVLCALFSIYIFSQYNLIQYKMCASVCMHLFISKSSLRCCLQTAYLQNHSMGICSITCDGISTLRLSEEVCLHSANRARKRTLVHTVLSAGFVLQSHAIYNMGPAGLCSSCVPAEEDGDGAACHLGSALHWMQSPW